MSRMLYDPSFKWSREATVAETLKRHGFKPTTEKERAEAQRRMRERQLQEKAFAPAVIRSLRSVK